MPDQMSEDEIEVMQTVCKNLVVNNSNLNSKLRGQAELLIESRRVIKQLKELLNRRGDLRHYALKKRVDNLLQKLK